MKFLYGLNQIRQLSTNVAATIGNFDGLHRGHQDLMASLQEKARSLALPVLVILFEPQPSEYLNKTRAIPRLMSLRSKLQVLAHMQVDFVCCLRFNEKLAAMSASTFANEVLFRMCHIRHLLVGNDFRFGKGREGDFALLQNIGKDYDATVERCPDFLLDHQIKVSSTEIRNLLQQGNLKEAAVRLGRTYFISGRVTHGAKRGRQLGCPTANLCLQQQNLALSGVYMVYAKRLCDERFYQGVANIGKRPTLNLGFEVKLEVHLFDFNDEIYGERLEVFFLHKLRDEKKFDSFQQLAVQIQADIHAARLKFSTHPLPLTV